MSCAQCGKVITNEVEMKLLNCDGDFACGKSCERKYIAARDHFFSVTVHSEELTSAYILGA